VNLVLQNVHVEGTNIAVSTPNADKPILTGNLVKAWAMGPRYAAKYPDGKYIAGNLDPFPMSQSLRQGERIFGKDKPQYADKAPTDFWDVTRLGLNNTGHVGSAEDNRVKIQVVLDEAAKQGNSTTPRATCIFFRRLM
jgi:hypothetical protein